MENTAILDFTFNAVGIVGVGLIIIAFFLLQSGKLTSKDMVYPVLNLVGAILHIISLYRFWNVASFVIEIFWIGISAYGIWKIKKNIGV